MKNIKKNIARAYEGSPLAKGIVNAFPYGSGLDSYLSALSDEARPNALKCERTIGKLIEMIQESSHKDLLDFRLWKRDEAIRKLLGEILLFHFENDYSPKAPNNLIYDHGDETGVEKVTLEMLRPIYRMLFERSLLWEDPHNYKILITDFGKEVLRYVNEA